jgi:hypothetical protein
MRQKFVFYPDQTRARLEPHAAARKAAIIFGVVVAGIIGLHVLYPAADAAIEPGPRADLLNQPRDVSALALSQTASAQVLRLPPVDAPLMQASEAELATTRSTATDSGPAPAGQFQVSGSAIAQGPGESASEVLPNKTANPPPAPKKKSAQLRRSNIGGAYAQYPYGGYGGQWAWYSHRPSPSPFFHF